MDGLTIRGAQNLLNNPVSPKELNDIAQPSSPALGPTVGGADSTQKNFADTLKDAVNQVNTLQQESNTKMQELATGKSQNVHETMIAAEKADIALRLMVQVRNKMIEAYQEMMRMQV